MNTLYLQWLAIKTCCFVLFAAGIFIQTDLIGRIVPKYTSGSVTVYFLATSNSVMNISISSFWQHMDPITVIFNCYTFTYRFCLCIVCFSYCLLHYRLCWFAPFKYFLKWQTTPQLAWSWSCHPLSNFGDLYHMSEGSYESSFLLGGPKSNLHLFTARSC